MDETQHMRVLERPLPQASIQVAGIKKNGSFATLARSAVREIHFLSKGPKERKTSKIMERF